MNSLSPPRRTFAFPFGLGLGCALAASALALAQSGTQLIRLYELIELRAEGDAQSRAYALNNTGQIVGWVEAGDNHHAAHWHNRVVTDLHGTVHFELLHPYPYYTEGYAEAYHVSDADQVVGTARTMTPSPPCVTQVLITNAFILRPGVLTDLATPYPGDALTNLGNFGDACTDTFDSAAVGISNSNYVVGWADLAGQIMHAFLVHPVNGAWVQRDGVGPNLLLIDLGTLAASDPISSATAVNDAGQVTGYSYTIGADGTASYRAFLLTPLDADADGTADQWSPNPGGVNPLMADLGTLGGSNSWGRAINADGAVVGESDYDAPSGAHYTHAFYAYQGAITDLGTLRDDSRTGFSAASGINNPGVIVGWAENEQRERRAFIYEDGQMTDLNTQLYLLNEDGSRTTPSIVLTEARDINDDGVIVGWGEIKGSDGARTRGFLLNPVLVDPTVLEEGDETGGATAGTTATGGPTYSSAPDFGPPGDLTTPAADGDGNDVAPTAAPTAPGLCGAQSLTLLPLTVLALCWRRRK